MWPALKITLMVNHQYLMVISLNFNISHIGPTQLLNKTLSMSHILYHDTYLQYLFYWYLYLIFQPFMIPKGQIDSLSKLI